MGQLGPASAPGNAYYVLRHGQSKANAAGIIVSRLGRDRGGDYGLTALGREQALAAGRPVPADRVPADIAPPDSVPPDRAPAPTDSAPAGTVRLRSSAAATSPLNNGCGRVGRDSSSG